MANTHISGFGEIRKKIAESISHTIHTFATTSRRGVGEALSLFASDRTIHPESMKVVLDFYKKGEAEREAFFTMLAALDPRKADYVLNQIFAAMDTPVWLIQIRADLIALIKKLSAAKQENGTLKPLKALSRTFIDYFARIFNFQYMVTRCCNAQNTSIALLKFISEKEGVHPTEHWWNFDNRLDSPDHIILSLEHFKMPYVPLVYIEVALSNGLIRKMSRILGDKRRPPDLRRADTAIFYSVNTTFAGLEGIALGAKMIIRASEYIQKNYPGIRHFATLSPIPKFRDYLATVLAGGTHTFSLTSQKIDANKKGRFISDGGLRSIREELSKKDKDIETLPISGMLKGVLGDEQWHANPLLRRAMEHPMAELTRYYLTREKRIDPKTRARTTNAYDPVANFHLSNGASIGNINYLANPSERGMRESYGMMANYFYEAEHQERNKLAYASGKVAIEI
ncbi:MAG: malonyl-CoA decarboxylase family protein [Candidatus Aureabacteria bacterium]|nr:malonyl-CoA decarboxylase family protein [Candidatus Auribacterota bacterium]